VTGIFGPSQLDALVRAQLETLPADKHGALVGTVDANGAQLVLSYQRTGRADWSIEAAMRHNWTGANTVGLSAKVLF
jgi:hypothetical protein